MPALFLSLDGLDGTGKSTQVRLLADYLQQQGHSVETCVDPGGTPLGQQLRGILLSNRLEMGAMTEALLFMASRAELIERVIRPALAAGKIVLSDRFLLANVVYQGYGGQLPVEELWRIGRLASGGLEPTLTIVLDLAVEQAQARRGRAADRMEERDRAYHERVRAGFLTEAKRQPDRIKVVDASESQESVHLAIVAEVERVLAAHPRS
jgi:dTMP kinase